MDLSFHSPILPAAGLDWARRDAAAQVTSRAPVLPEEKGIPRRRADSEAGERNRRPVLVEENDDDALPKARGELSDEEKARLRELKARDAEVRAHEAAHLAAAGGIAISGASYEMVTGPDGRQYAVGGEVSISVSEEATPEETLRKARQVQAAALAPAEPSSTDRQVAAQAAAMAAQAAAEMASKQAEESSAKSANPNNPGQLEFPFARESASGSAPSLLQRVVEAYSRTTAPMPPQQGRLFGYA